jgi:MFS family permease
MKAIQSTHDQTPTIPAGPAEDAGELTGGLTFLMAAVAVLGVSALYYTQPMLAVMAADLRAAPATLATVPMLTQLGYAAGILLLAPLGDRIDRRRIILAKAATLAGTLAVAALAQGIAVLLIASFVLGLAATLAQDVVSSAATLAPDSSRGRVVGTVMTGLLLGILLSRTVSGLVAQQFGWRAMLWVAAVGIINARVKLTH